MTPKIFISYRRLDSEFVADSVYNEMQRHFGEGNVFLDVGEIPFGVDFRVYLREQIAEHDVVLVLIGPKWGDIMRERASQANDFVRIEIENALAQNKLVIPTLVMRLENMPDFSTLPASIADLQWRNVAKIRREPDFKPDCQRLADNIKKVLNGAAKPPVVPVQPVEPKEMSLKPPMEQVFPPPRPEPPTSSSQLPKQLANPLSSDSVDSVIRPAPLSKAVPYITQLSRLPRPYSYSRELQNEIKRARNFAETGESNNDWETAIITFRELKIPDIPFCLVPTGTFEMGEGKEAHPQTFNEPFYIAKYPITNAQWRVAVKAGAVKEPQGETAKQWYLDPKMANAPVVGISWFEAQKFTQWVGCRLPTEREWEYAARGVESWVYPWGNEWDPGKAIHEGNSGAKPWDVTSKPNGASWVGARHLIGNVWDWTVSLYGKYPYPNDGRREVNNYKPTNNIFVLRGGSFINIAYGLNATNRSWSDPDDWDNNIGFRCAGSV